MSVEADSNPGYVNRTILDMHKMAALLASGRTILTTALQRPPFVPNFIDEDLGTQVWEGAGLKFEKESFGIVQKSFDWTRVIARQVMHRAELQEKWSIHPELQTRILVAIVNEQLPSALRIDPTKARVVWGALCFGLVVPSDDYNSLLKAFTDVEASGFKSLGVVTSRFYGDLGPIPIILKGKEAVKALRHEEIHILQDLFGWLGSDFDFETMLIQYPGFERCALQENIQPGDLKECFTILEAAARDAEREIDLEFQTVSWEAGRIPHTTTMDAPKSLMNLALSATFNAIYDSEAGLTNEEKVLFTFKAQNRFNSINVRRLQMAKILNQARLEYNGPLNRNDFVGALTLLIPPGSSIRLIEAVMLGGRDKRLSEPVPRIVASDIAGAIATFARRTVSPTSYGQGEVAKSEDVTRFISLVSQTFNSGALIRPIIDSLGGISEEEFSETRRKLIEYGRKSVPAGMRGAVAKILTQELVTNQVIPN